MFAVEKLSNSFRLRHRDGNIIGIIHGSTWASARAAHMLAMSCELDGFLRTISLRKCTLGWVEAAADELLKALPASDIEKAAIRLKAHLSGGEQYKDRDKLLSDFDLVADELKDYWTRAPL